MPEISVIVPVYRAESYLKECVDSILTQSFSDIQVILVDDGSPDNCGAICDAYASRDPRVVAIHQKNQGQAAARNHALPVAKGAWLCFVDSDDRIHPQMLEYLHRVATESGAGISMCAMLEAPVFPEDFDAPREMTYETLTMDEKTLLSLWDRGSYPGWVACAKLIRREYVERYPFQEGRVYEDNEAGCHWLLPAGVVASMPQALYFYRTNPDSTTKSRFSLKKLDYLWALERIMVFYRSSGYHVLARRFLERYVEAVASACNGLHHDLNQPKRVRKQVNHTFRYLKRSGQKLTKTERLTILEAAYPKAMARFWYAAGKLKKWMNGRKKAK